MKKEKLLSGINKNYDLANKKIGRDLMEYEIREIINRNSGEFYEKYFKNYLNDWNTLCASMDTIGDTTLAIDYFKETGIGQDDGEKYLKLYGLLQAVYLQQDAIKFLFQIIKRCFDNKNKIKKWNDYLLENWNVLRNYRNLSVGHPIENRTFERGKTKRVFISRITISSDGFQLMICDAETGSHQFQNVQLKDLIESYLFEAKTILSDVENFLRNYVF